MTPAEVEATACQTPLVDLLRAIPADAILRWNDGPHSSHSAPIGKYAREAADALAAQAVELERMREAFTYVCGLLPGAAGAIDREADTYVLNCMVNIGELRRVRSYRQALKAE